MHTYKTLALFFLLLALTPLSSCKNDTKTVEESQETGEKEVEMEEEEILLGLQSRQALEQAPYNSWFTENYEDYELDQELLPDLEQALQGVEITLFMGTWCSDSQREVPRFYKILDAANYDADQIRLITVTEEKDTPAGYEDGLNITNVPTMIFTKEGEELGRIVEYPVESLEKDMLKILTGAPYEHAYAE
ncbi:thioredoxin family protein [Croceiramulus getboli]|nr:thioredoxin family protein [Flavobacteriaceae bacterium YJPT1-3]